MTNMDKTLNKPQNKPTEPVPAPKGPDDVNQPIPVEEQPSVEPSQDAE